MGQEKMRGKNRFLSEMRDSTRRRSHRVPAHGRPTEKPSVERFKIEGDETMRRSRGTKESVSWLGGISSEMRLCIYPPRFRLNHRLTTPGHRETSINQRMGRSGLHANTYVGGEINAPEPS